MNTKLTTLSELQVGSVTSREGNDGEIIETVVAVEKKGAYIHYTVECNGKTYTMSGRLSAVVRQCA